MKKIYRTLFRTVPVILFMLLTGVAFAQSRLVTGTISDVSGFGLPGVNVIKKGTAIGTTTDGSGKYSIEAADEDILVFSFIGYQTQEIRVGTQTLINVVMSEDIATLDEIVVVGYGTQKKTDLTGAVSRVDESTLKASIVTNIDQALQGRVAGVNISSNSGAPGAATTINIRGISTFGSSQPLYVIDGVQISGEGGSVAGFTDGANGNTRVNPLSTINPNDIASIDVLKDASASAIYGSRASNGVIIITTKRGQSGEAKISYNGYYAFQTPRKKLDTMTLPEYAAYRVDIARDFGNTPPEQFLDPSILGPGTDWQDEIFRTAPMQSHHLSATGGNEKTKYAIMGGYFDQEGLAINSSLSRFTTRVNLDTKLKDWFTIGTNLSYSNTKENIIMDASGDGVISQALSMSPDVPVRDLDGNYAGPAQNAGSAEIQSNPVGLAEMRTNDLNRQRLLLNNYAEITIKKDIVIRSEFSVDNNFSQNVNFSPSYRWGSLVEGESQLQDRRENSLFWLWKTYATYNKNFGGHHFQLMVGTEKQRNTYEQTYVLKRNLATNDILVLSQGDQDNQNTNGVLQSNALMSYYGRLNYNLNDKYLVTLTLRGDGSSRFGPNNRWGYFPSAAIAWRLSNESFFPQSQVIDDVKIRAGYGEVGNQNIANYAYGSSLTAVNSPFGTTYRLNRLPNPDVKWESSIQYNVGLDVSLLAGRIDLVVDAYKKSSRDFLMTLPLPTIFGGGGGQGSIGAPFVNLGQMDNQGIDLAINTVNIDKGKFKWETGFTYSMYRNEIVELASENASVDANLYFYGVFNIPTRSVIGQPVGQFYGYVTDGIFKTEEEILNAPVQVLNPGSETTERPQGTNFIHNRDGVWIGDIKYKDLNNDGVIDTDDQTFIGNPNPKFSFGLNNTFKYGNFDLNVYITGVYGFDIFNASRIRTEGMLNQSNNQLSTISNRAQIELIDPNGSLDDISNVRLINSDTNIPRFTSTNVNGNARISQDRWIEDGSFLRIQNLALGYTLPQSTISKFGLQMVRVYFNAQNLFILTDYQGLDPEVGASNQNILTTGIDTGRYPTPRVFTLGLNVDF